MRRPLHARLIACLWFATAFCTVAAAVVVSVMRLLLPQIGEYRDEIQAWVSEYMAQPVVIERISAEWRGWTPELQLDGIRLEDAARERTLTRFERARIAIDLWASVRHRRLVPGRLTVSGVRLSLLRGANGAIRIEGVDPQSTELPGMRQNALADWLQKQRNLTVESATIGWRDEQGLIAPVVFSDVWLHIRSDGERRQLSGSARLPAEVGEAFNFLLDARGDLLTTNWSGELYLDGRGISPTALLNYRNWLGLEFTGGDIGFRLWSRWDNARLEGMDGMVEGRDLAVGVRWQAAGAGRFVIRNAGANLRVRRTADARWTIALERLQVNTGNGRWPHSDLALTLVPAGDGGFPSLVARAGFLRLDDISPLLPHIEAIPEAVRTPLERIAPRGDLRDVRLGYFPAREAEQRFYAHLRFSGIEVQPLAPLPGVSGLAGSVGLDAGGGRLRLDPGPLVIDAGARLPEPLRLDRAGGELRWTRRGDGWHFASDGLQLAHRALDLTTSGEIEWQPDTAPQANLLAAIGGGDLEHLNEVIPHGLLRGKGRERLLQALQGGHIGAGAGVLRGPLDRFPFDAAEGVFKLRFTLADGLLEFSPRWPRVEEIEAEVLVQGRSLTVDAPRARMLGAELREVRAVIDDLAARERTVQARGQAFAPAPEARRIVAASPLQDRLGRQLAGLNVDGPLELDLELEVPLRRGAKPRSLGTVRLAGNAVTATDLRLRLEAVHGAIGFEGRHWQAHEVQARYLGRPVRLDLEGGLAGDGAASRYRMSGIADAALIERQLQDTAPGLLAWVQHHGLLSSLSGQASWQAELSVSDPGGGGERRLVVESDLAGLAVDLPFPAGKPAAAPRRLRLRSTPGDPGGVLELDYGETLQARLATGGEAGGPRTLRALAVGLGVPAPALAGIEGIRLEGALAELSASAWREALDRAEPGREQTQALPVSFDLRVADLEALGQHFPEVGLRGHGSAEGWILQFDGERLAGTVDFAHARPIPLRAELERLHLVRPAAAAQRPALDPAALPAIEAHSAQLWFDDLDLGAAHLSTTPADDGLRLEALTLSSDDFDLRASGEWRLADRTHISHFDIGVTGPDLGRLLSRFGYAVASVQGGRTAIDIDATWPGTPAEFALPRLAGELRIRVRDGRLLDVDPKAGRLFGLLSIQTLPRRLALDFNDLFLRGFSFDRIDGTFELERGNAYTNSLVMAGPSARIEVTGRTGLAEQDYDQIVTVRPQIASSLPLASALFGPAGAGVGAVLFLGQKIFKGMPQLDNMLSRQYSVTGDWHDPIIEQVGGLDLSFGG